jgi:hypothetical protein
VGAAQTPPGGDEQSRFLEVRRRQVELQAARTRLEQHERLFADALISKTELDRARTELEIAQLNYQVAVLALLNLQPRVTVREAVKYEAEDGRKFVRLTVVNQTPTFDDSQYQILANFEGAAPIPPELRTRDVRDVYVSLRDTGERPATAEGDGRRGVTIGVPYEQHIPELAYDQSKTLTFQLLRDVQSVVVAVFYKGQEQQIDVQLQQAATESPIAITATQIAQEVDLGTEASYELLLDRPSVDARSFELRVVNLPRQISTSFVDPRTGARLSELRFPAGVTQQLLQLRLFLPKEGDDQVRIDEPLPFFALAMTPEEAAHFQGDGAYALDAVKASRAGYVALTVTPRGVGRIEVSARSLFSEIVAGEAVGTELQVKNNGSRRLDTVRFTTEPPFGWRAEVAPASLPALAIGEEAHVRLAITPPADVPAGDYEVRLKTESYAYNRPVPTEDKIYRVSVRSRVNILGISLVVALLLVVLGGIVVSGIKLTRR